MVASLSVVSVSFSVVRVSVSFSARSYSATFSYTWWRKGPHGNPVMPQPEQAARSVISRSYLVTVETESQSAVQTGFPAPAFLPQPPGLDYRPRTEFFHTEGGHKGLGDGRQCFVLLLCTLKKKTYPVSTSLFDSRLFATKFCSLGQACLELLAMFLPQQCVPEMGC